MSPQVEQVAEIQDAKIDNKGDNENLISAISSGAMEGVHMAMAVGTSLIAIISLVALCNVILDIFGITLEQIFSYIFAPIGLFMGLDIKDILLAGQLLGSKMVLNEFVAFSELGPILGSLDIRTGMMLSIALSGFANISSMGMCVSGISILCPEKRGHLAELVFRSMIGGFAVSILSSLVIGLILLF